MSRVAVGFAIMVAAWFLPTTIRYATEKIEHARSNSITRMSRAEWKKENEQFILHRDHEERRTALLCGGLIGAAWVLAGLKLNVSKQ